MLIQVEPGGHNEGRRKRNRWSERSLDMTARKPDRMSSDMSKTASTVSTSQSKDECSTPHRSNRSVTKDTLSLDSASLTTNPEDPIPASSRRVTFSEQNEYNSIPEVTVEDEETSAHELSIVSSSDGDSWEMKRVPSYLKDHHKANDEILYSSFSSVSTDSDSEQGEPKYHNGDRNHDILYDNVNRDKIYDDDTLEEVIREFQLEEADRQRSRKYFVESVNGQLYIDRKLEPKQTKSKKKKTKRHRQRRLPRYMPQPHPIVEEDTYDSKSDEVYSLEDFTDYTGSVNYSNRYSFMSEPSLDPSLDPSAEEELYHGQHCSLEEYSEEDSVDKRVVRQATSQRRLIHRDGGFYMETRTFVSVTTTSFSDTRDDGRINTDEDSTISTGDIIMPLPLQSPIQSSLPFPPQAAPQDAPQAAPKKPKIGRWQRTAMARQQAQNQHAYQMPMFSEEAWYTYQSERDEEVAAKKQRTWFPRLLRRKPKRILKALRSKLTRFLPRLKRKNKHDKKYQVIMSDASSHSHLSISSLPPHDTQETISINEPSVPEVEKAPKFIAKVSHSTTEGSSSDEDSTNKKSEISDFPGVITSRFSSLDEVDNTLKQHLQQMGVSIHSHDTTRKSSKSLAPQ